WEFDMLKYRYTDLCLVVAGTGPGRCNLERFARNIGARDRVHFVGAQPDLSPFYRRAEVVWVPGLSGDGLNIVLEAMAHGRPVMVSRHPRLCDAIVEGKTGWLVQPGDKVALARRTRWLLENVEQRDEIAKAGRQNVM